MLKNIIERLKREAISAPHKRSRDILVPGFDMVICLAHGSRVGKHRHPQFEAYHLIEGVLLVALENEVRILDKDHPFMSIPAGMWHAPTASTDFAIYREFYCGPFEKARDVEYA